MLGLQPPQGKQPPPACKVAFQEAVTSESAHIKISAKAMAQWPCPSRSAKTVWEKNRAQASTKVQCWVNASRIGPGLVPTSSSSHFNKSLSVTQAINISFFFPVSTLHQVPAVQEERGAVLTHWWDWWVTTQSTHACCSRCSCCFVHCLWSCLIYWVSSWRTQITSYFSITSSPNITEWLKHFESKAHVCYCFFPVSRITQESYLFIRSLPQSTAHIYIHF